MGTLRLCVAGLIAAGILLCETGARPGKYRGTSVAAVRIEVFSDFQCPACKTLHDQTIKPLIADYVDRGKVYLINREFPLPMHQYAREAACYASAAERVGKYEQTSDALFAAQEVWSKNGKVAETVMSVLSPAEAKQVRALAKSPDIVSEVDRDVQAGQANRVQQTPTMVVTHKGKTYPVSGVVNYGILRRFIDQLLTQ